MEGSRSPRPIAASREPMGGADSIIRSESVAAGSGGRGGWAGRVSVGCSVLQWHSARERHPTGALAMSRSRPADFPASVRRLPRSVRGLRRGLSLVPGHDRAASLAYGGRLVADGVSRGLCRRPACQSLAQLSMRPSPPSSGGFGQRQGSRRRLSRRGPPRFASRVSSRSSTTCSTCRHLGQPAGT